MVYVYSNAFKTLFVIIQRIYTIKYFRKSFMYLPLVELYSPMYLFVKYLTVTAENKYKH